MQCEISDWTLDQKKKKKRKEEREAGREDGQAIKKIIGTIGEIWICVCIMLYYSTNVKFPKCD